METGYRLRASLVPFYLRESLPWILRFDHSLLRVFVHGYILVGRLGANRLFTDHPSFNGKKAPHFFSVLRRTHGVMDESLGHRQGKT